MGKKTKRFWKITRVFITIIIILLAAIVILPYVFKGKIMTVVKVEINKNVEATVDFSDFGLSLVTNFPNFSFHLDDISVVGKNEFEGDTLARIGSVSAAIDLFSVFSGNVYQVRKISVENPYFHFIINENNKTNWDIVPTAEEVPKKETKSVEESKPAEIKILLNKFEILNANLVYQDIPGNLELKVINLNHVLSGDLSADKTSLRTKTSIESTSFTQAGIELLKNTFIEFDAVFDADMKNEIFTFKKNHLKINELELLFEGSVAPTGDDLNIMLTYSAAKNTFKNFLSLIPAIYMKDFQDIQTSGNLAFNGYVKGIYSEDKLPSFKLDVNVDNAEFKYPDLPDAVKDIAISIHIDNPGGDANNTVINVEKFHFSMIDNPVDLKLLLKNPLTDPYIEASLVGLMDFASIAMVYPMESGESISGTLDANIRVKGRQSSIDNEKYEDFDAFGSLLIKEMKYSMKSFNDAFVINHAQMNFSPVYLDLVNLDFSYAESDMMIKGKIENYIAYALSSKTLTADFTASSNNFDLNSFMGEEEGEEENPSQQNTTTLPSDKVEMTAFEVPANVDFKLDAQFTKLTYSSMVFDNLTGDILVKDETVTLQNLKGNIVEGTVSLNGFYSTQNTKKPKVDIKVNIDKISFKDAFKAFDILQKFAPIFKNAMGDFSTNMSFNTELQSNMSPDWKTLIANGLMNTTSIKLENVNTLNKLSGALKTDAFNSMDLNPIKLAFDIEDGKLMVKPFDFVMKGMKGNLSGTTALDQSIDYNLNMEVPRNMFGAQANQVLDGLLSQANSAGGNFSLGETIDLGVLIGGSIDNPTVTPSLGSSGKNVIEDVKQNIQQEIDKKKEEATQKAKDEAKKILDGAESQAQKIIQEAQKQADQIKATARTAAQKVRSEADSHAQKLIAEGKKNGMIAEIAAKKTADEYKKNANKEADNLVKEADKQADGIMNTANQQAAKVRSDAQKKVDGL
ncbi:AsmA-like C-terminal region-containing protein [Bacteroidota bacterium]